MDSKSKPSALDFAGSVEFDSAPAYRIQNSAADAEYLADDLIATLQGIVLVLDEDGAITLGNPYFEELTGYTSAELLGRDWFSTFIPDTERAETRMIFDQIMRSGVNRGHTNALITKGGEQRMIQWYSKTLEDSNGNFIGLLNSGYDVTEQVALQASLCNARENAERATATKSRFLAAASHDLRQPLQSIDLYLSVLSRRSEEPIVKELAAKMQRSVNVMADILTALLDISKLNSGALKAEPCEFPLQSLLDQVAASNGAQARDKQLVLRVEPCEFIVNSDPLLLQRIVDNFVSNALRYTNSGGVTISCHASEGKARIDVVDTGIGIPADAQEDIFDEHVQLGNLEQSSGKGFGLGLAIAKYIAQLLGHELAVQSAPGEGSTFSVFLPCVAESRMDLLQLTTAATRRTPSYATRVLFVDDDPSIVDATAMWLTVEGFEVCTATNGEQACALIENGFQPEILISDYHLPGYTGLELARRVRRLLNKDIPSILMTGDTSLPEIAPENLTQCTKIHKPIDIARLSALIQNVCG